MEAQEELNIEIIEKEEVSFIDSEEEEGEEKQVEVPDSLKERLEKLNVLLKKTETFSKFMEQQIEEAKKTEVIEKSPKKQKKDHKHNNYSQPKILTGGKLRDYQLVGMNWLIKLYLQGVHGILADEMGLGKTLQTISLFAHLYEQGIKGPFLVVCPLSTVTNWINEIKKFVPCFKVLLYHGTKEERTELRREFSDSINVYVTSYEIAIRDKTHLKKLKFKYLVVDEAHRLKNFNCKLVKQLKQYNAESRLLLTGTPLQNNLSELWSLLNFLLPEIFDDLTSFESWFNFTATKDADKELIIQEKQKLVTTLHSILRPFLLRRLKVDVDYNIPPKKEYILYVKMVPVQREFYDCIKNRDFDPLFQKYVQKEKKKEIQSKSLLNILMQLRKVCNHTFLLQDFIEKQGESELEEQIRYFKECVEGSGKFQILDKMLPILKKKGHKVLIFSLMTKMLDILEVYLNNRGHKYCRIDGQTAQKDRQSQIDEYNKDKEIFAFLLSTRAGGLGINLTSADTVIIYDSDFNPQVDLQAQDRCHRIGQSKPVRVFRLITTDSIEKKVLLTATKKLNLEKLIISKGNFKGNKNEKQTESLTKEIFDSLSSKEEKSPYETEMISDENLYTLLTERDKEIINGKGFELFNVHHETFNLE